MRESDIENYLRKRTKALGGLALKWVSPGCTGVPDRIVLLPGGRIAFAELKAPGKVPRKRQRHVMDLLIALGFTVEAIDSNESVEQFLTSLLLLEGIPQ